MLLFVNVAAYLMYTQDGSIFAQGRYLFPAIGVFGALVAAGYSVFAVNPLQASRCRERPRGWSAASRWG